jgi:hypothetical protein
VNFATELIELMPRKFRVLPVWQELFESFGEVLDEIHVKIDGLPDLTDPEAVPVEYMQYLARNMGVPLPLTDGTQDEYRKRWFLRSIPWIIKNKGIASLIEELARFLFFFSFPAAEMEIYEQWTNDYLNFYFPPLDIIEVPAGWTGDGGTATYAETLANPPVRVRSIHITTLDTGDVPMEAWDDGDGVMRGDITAGSINHATGVISVTFVNNVKSGEDVTVAYTIEDDQYLTPHYLLAFPTNIYLDMGIDPVSFTPSGWTGNGVLTNFTTTVSKRPIKAGTIKMTTLDTGDNPMEVTDDGSGNLVGDVGAGANSVDYITGDFDVTFSAAVKSGEDIVLEYDHQNIYLGRRRVDEMVAYLDRYRPAHTVFTIGLGTLEDFWRVESQRWRVGDFNDPAVPSPTNEEIIRVGSPAWL